MSTIMSDLSGDRPPPSSSVGAATWAGISVADAIAGYPAIPAVPAKAARLVRGEAA